jgi:hypothetical protein
MKAEENALTMPATITSDLAVVLHKCDQRGDDYSQMAQAVLSTLADLGLVPRAEYMRQVGKAHGLAAALRHCRNCECTCARSDLACPQCHTARLPFSAPKESQSGDSR